MIFLPVNLSLGRIWLIALSVKSMLARARQGRKTNRTIKIVTFDWLEDSIDAGKPIPNTDKYDPGKPRGIDGMVAAWKETKFSSKTDICGSNKTARVKKVKVSGHGSTLGRLSMLTL